MFNKQIGEKKFAYRLQMLHVHYTKGVQKVLQIDIQKIHKALEFDFI